MFVIVSSFGRNWFFNSGFLARKINDTMIENHPKCPIWVFQFCHFPLILVLLKVNCLVTLFDLKYQVFKNSPKVTIFGIFNELIVHSKCKRSSLRSQCSMRLFSDFQTLWSMILICYAGNLVEWDFFMVIILHCDYMGSKCIFRCILQIGPRIE